jgi:hypothetical protein
MSTHVMLNKVAAALERAINTGNWLPAPAKTTAAEPSTRIGTSINRSWTAIKTANCLLNPAQKRQFYLFEGLGKNSPLGHESAIGR